MKKIKLCFITKFVKGIHKYTGGMESHVDDLLKELVKDKNLDITIITSKHPDGIEFRQKNRINYYYIKSTIRRNPFSRYKFFKDVARKLKELKYESKFDLIHIQSDFGVGYFQYIKKKLPVLSTAHGTTINEFKGSIKAKPYLIPLWFVILPFYYLTEKNMIKNSDKIICVSGLVKRSLINQYNLNKDKVITVLNGIDLNKFKRIKNNKTKALRKKYANKKDFLILSVGNIIKQKGYHLMINAMPKLLKKKLNVKLLVVGEGDYLKELKTIVRRKKLEKNVFFTGKIKREELVNYYSISDLFAFPTLRGEGLPYTLIEAMACGNVILTTPNGGTDLVNEENGILINANQRGSIVNSTIKIMEDKKYSKKLLKKSIEDIKNNFDVKKMIKKNKEIYKEVLKK